MATQTSSANPAALAHYADVAADINRRLDHEAGQLEGALATFAASCAEPRSGVGPHLAEPLRAHVRATAPRDEWVREVARAFERADQGAIKVGLKFLKAYVEARDGLVDYLDIRTGLMAYRKTSKRRVPLSAWKLRPGADGKLRIQTSPEIMREAGLDLKLRTAPAVYKPTWSALMQQNGRQALAGGKEAMLPRSLLGKALVGAQIGNNWAENWQEFKGEGTGDRIGKAAVATAIDTTIETGFSVAGTIAGSAIGGAALSPLGPLGVVVGSRIGGWAGGLAGGWLGEKVAKSDPIKNARNWFANKLFD